MANVKDFNPNAVLVVRGRRGLRIGGRLYQQGAAVADDCLSMRKRQQLFAQNYLCYPHDLDTEVVEKAEVVELDEKKEDKESKDVKPEAGNGDDAESDKSEEKSEDKPEEVSETQEGEGESSDESEQSTEEVAEEYKSESDEDSPSPSSISLVGVGELRALWKIERILIMDAIVNTADKGQANTHGFIAGDVALLVYSAPNPGLMVPSAGYDFNWSGLLGSSGGLGTRVSKFRMEELKSDRVEIEMAFDLKLVAADLGTLFFNVLA